MPNSHTLKVGGRDVGYVDYGPRDGTPVLWCHGGPGSRLEPAALAPAAAGAGFRLIGIDRPGYGRSTPRPGRSIGDWVADGLAVADALDVERFVAVGCSTGGAYSLSLAAGAPQRVAAVIACCALTDMRWQDGKAMMAGPATARLWSASDREAAIAAATDVLGADGSKMLTQAQTGAPMPAADLALMQDSAWMAGMLEAMREMFTFGTQGYADDRIADGVGWGSFDVARIRCPVVVLHGEEDNVVPVAHARHTAAIVPGATLRIVPALGHMSIFGAVLPALQSLTLKKQSKETSR
jgi:pimeloyl-ACP methyl ester carboxylesterase